MTRFRVNYIPESLFCVLNGTALWISITRNEYFIKIESIVYKTDVKQTANKPIPVVVRPTDPERTLYLSVK